MKKKPLLSKSKFSFRFAVFHTMKIKIPTVDYKTVGAAKDENI
jgi:hypothetical protein